MDVMCALADRLDPPPVDVLGILGYKPTPKQLAFLDAREYDVGYGGALGGGKTSALTMLAVRACATIPNLTVGIFRRTYPELEDSIVKELARFSFAAALGAKWRLAKRELHFTNGSVIECRYCESMVDATRYQGAQYQMLCIDERTLMAPDVVEYLESRIRSGDWAVPVIGVRSSFNPGGPGHGAAKAMFVDATEHGAKVVTDAETGKTRRFIPARAEDNPHLDPGYIARLNSLPPALRAAFRDGSFDSFQGQVFSEWRHDRHVVARRTLPAEWSRWMSIDWGYAAPHAVLWAAKDHDGRLWMYRELYGTQVGETELAKAILAAEAAAQATSVDAEGSPVYVAEPMPHRVADPSMWNRSGEGLPIATRMGQEGVAMRPAENDRLNGWQRLHSYLADGPACDMHRSQGWERCPMLHVIEDGCPNLVRTLPNLPYDKLRVEDVDTHAEDHCGDSLRYLCMAVGTVGEFYFPPEEPAPHALDGSELMVEMPGGMAMRTTDAGVSDTPRGAIVRAPWAG